MNLEYETTLEDISEPQIRHYLRSKTFQKQRFTEPIRTGIVSIFTIYLITLMRDSSMPWWSYPLAFLAGYSVIYITLRDTVTKRMQKYIKNEIGHKLPATTRYIIENGKIRCDSLGAEITFNLDSLSEIREDTTHLELDFGDVGLCTIPVRAFKDTSHKNDFLNNIRREQDETQQPLSAALFT
jgi:hypothetical protein